MRPKKRVRFRVTDEAGLRDAFAIFHQELGYQIVRSQSRFPDYVLEQDGKTIRAEAEYKSSSFAHDKRHDPNKCDLIICWEDDLDSYQVERLALVNYVQDRPLFEPLPKEETSKLQVLPEDSGTILRAAKSIWQIVEDVVDIFKSDHRARDRQPEYLPEDWVESKFTEAKKSGLSKEAKKSFTRDLLYLGRGWLWDESVAVLVVDFGSMSLNVEGRVYERVIEELDGDKTNRILSHIGALGHLGVRYGAKAGRDGLEFDASDPEALYTNIHMKNVISVSFVSSHSLNEILSSNPYDVVGKLHDELDDMLNLIEGEHLYIRKSG